MPISPESLDNFHRGVHDDSFLGVAIRIANTETYTIHLAAAERLDHTEIPQGRLSTVGGIRRRPLPGGGGHATLVNWAGGQATQLAPGMATGDAFGFSIVKDNRSVFRAGTYRSGFNTQYDGLRPGFARGTTDQQRTLSKTKIWQLLFELTGGIRGARTRSSSI